MSDFNLIDIVNLIRAEIRKTQVGPIKKVTGPQGPQGIQGESGSVGPQGPRGNDGKPGPIGSKGNQGRKGDKGNKGEDGVDGVGIARIEQDIDNAIIVILTDGSVYTIEMPIVRGDGNPTEVHYKVAGGGTTQINNNSGGGSGGSADLSGYVKVPEGFGDKWLVYNEATASWAVATTDLISTNSGEVFRDAKGKFRSTKNLEGLTDQLKVNRFIADELDALNEAIENIDIPEGADLSGYATNEQLNEVDQTAIMRDDALEKKHDEDHVKQAAINAGVVVSLDELFWRDVAIDDAFTAGDAHLQAEIDELALAVNTILLKHDSGKWKYIGDINDGAPRNAGDLSIIGDMDSTTNVVTMHAEDLNGSTHVYADIEVGDYMELVNVDDPQQYILYVVTAMGEATTNMLQADVALKRKAGGDFTIGTELEVRYYQISDQDIALEDLDERYVAKNGSWDMKTGTSLAVNVLKSVDGGTPFVYYEGDPEGTHPCGLVNRFMLHDYVDKKLEEGGGEGAEASETHTIMGKGAWGRSITDIATDKFIAFDYQGNTRNYLDNYAMGIAVGARYGDEFTEGLAWKQGAYVDVYDSDGRLLFAKEIDSVEHDAKGYLRLHWEWQPTMYTSKASLSYGDQLMLRITGLTGSTRHGRSSVQAPPEDDPQTGGEG